MSETSDPQPEPTPGISLDELTAAFAQAIGSRADGRAGGEDEVTAGPAEPETSQATAVETSPTSTLPEPEPQSGGEEDPCEICPRTILEAMLFVGNRENRPLAASRAAELMRGVEPEEIAALADELNRRYSVNRCPYHVTHVGSGYRLVLREAFDPLRNRFLGRVRQARLSQAAIDVLAVIAYQQPLTSEQVSQMRGKPSGHVLSQLVRRGLLRLERRDPKRRIASYSTTDRFLKLFGLESIDDLPRSEDLDHQ